MHLQEIIDQLKADERNASYTARGIGPIFQIHEEASILIIGQAPGKVFFAPAVAIPAAVGAAIHQVTGSILAGIFARHMEAREAKERASAEAQPVIEAVPGNH